MVEENTPLLYKGGDHVTEKNHVTSSVAVNSNNSNERVSLLENPLKCHDGYNVASSSVSSLNDDSHAYSMIKPLSTSAPSISISGDDNGSSSTATTPTLQRRPYYFKPPIVVQQERESRRNHRQFKLRDIMDEEYDSMKVDVSISSSRGASPARILNGSDTSEVRSCDQRSGIIPSSPCSSISSSNGMTNVGTEGRVVTPLHSSNDSKANMYQRYKYYHKLSRGKLSMPDHVVPSYLFRLLPFESSFGGDRSQSSLVTILTIWNTMMGTSVLTMPWAFEQSGLGLGLAIIVFMTALCFYTAYLVLAHSKDSSGRAIDFSDVCRLHFGVLGERIALSFSVMVLISAIMVYWVLMSGFLYDSVEFVYNRTYSNSANSSTWDSVWNAKNTPLFLIVILFPICNFKSLHIFTKFNSLGILSILYMLFFVCFKVFHNGVHVGPEDGIVWAKWSFPSFTGILTLSFFIHNSITSIMRNAKYPENNNRDLFLAYIFVLLTYLLVGVLFYLSYQGGKAHLLNNFLKNCANDDILAVVARMFLLFQMTTVFPLLTFIIRFQIFSYFKDDPYPSFWHICGLNVVLVSACVLISLYYPHIGDILRYSGAVTGLIYVFALPCLVHMRVLKERGQLSPIVRVINCSIIFLGFANFVSQFVISSNVAMEPKLPLSC